MRYPDGDAIAGFAPLASAIAGCAVTVQLGAQSFTDGRSITVATTRDGPIWLDICAQAAMIGAGSLDGALLRHLVGRPKTARRYLYLEVNRASHVLRDRLPLGFSRQPVFEAAQPLTESAAVSLALAAGKRALPEPPPFFGSIRPLFALRHKAADAGDTAGARSDGRENSAGHGVKLHAEDVATESSLLLRLLENPFSKGGWLSDMLNDLLGAGVSKGERDSNAAPAAGEIPVGRVERGLRRGVAALLGTLNIPLPALEDFTGGGQHVYPEWDMAKSRYRKNWVFVQEAEPWLGEDKRDFADFMAPPSVALRRQMADLGLGHEMRRRQSDGTELDTGAMIDYAIAVQSGHVPSRLEVYRASRRTRRDLGVVILLDISGSTASQDHEGQAVFKRQLQLAYQLGRTVDRLGDVSAIIGFHGWGRKQMRAVRIKGHHEAWSRAIDARFALLEPVGYTRTGAAIRHGAALLGNIIRQPNKLLLIITDGIPYDEDYELRYAEQDTRKALREARAAGTACLCISVGAETETGKLAEIFGAGNILAVDEPEEARLHIRQLCRRALAAVSKRRYAGRAMAG